MPQAAANCTERSSDWATERAQLQGRISELEQQLAWFKRQLFGEKSERRTIEPAPSQLSLGEGLQGPQSDPEASQPIAAHQRRRTPKPKRDEPRLFFDEQQVPVETITVPNPELEGLEEDEYERIGEKVTHRLAQRPGSYVILKYVRPLIKRKDTQRLHCPAAPA